MHKFMCTLYSPLQTTHDDFISFLESIKDPELRGEYTQQRLHKQFSTFSQKEVYWLISF